MASGFSENPTDSIYRILRRIISVRAALAIRLRTITIIVTALCFSSCATLRRNRHIADLLLELKNPAESERVKAAQALGAMGEDAVEAVPALITAAHDQDNRVASSAADALVQMGRSAVPALSAAALRPEFDRYSAIQVLGRMSAQAELVVPVLTKCLNVKYPAIGLLVLSGSEHGVNGVYGTPALNSPAARAGLFNSDRILAVNGKSVEGMGSSEVYRIIREAPGNSVTLTVKHWRGFKQFANSKDVPITATVHREEHNDEQATIMATQALAQIGPPAGAALPELKRLIAGRSLTMFDAEVDAAGKIEPVQKEDIPRLVEALKDQRLEVRAIAAKHLARLAPRDASVVISLCDALDGSGVFGPVAEALLTIIQMDPRLLVVALKKMNDNYGKSNDWIRAALKKYGHMPREAGPELLRALQHRNRYDDEFVASHIDSFDSSIPEIVPVLTHEMEERSEGTTDVVSDALGFLGPSAVSAVPALLSRTNCSHTLEAVKNIGEGAVPAVSHELRKSKDEGTRWRAANVMGRLGPKTVPYLIEALKRDPASRVRSMAAESLGGFGANARDALPILIKLSVSTDPELRRQVALAIGKIRSKPTEGR